MSERGLLTQLWFTTTTQTLPVNFTRYTLSFEQPQPLSALPPHASITPLEIQCSLRLTGRWRSPYLDLHLPLTPQRLTEGNELSGCFNGGPVNPYYPLKHCTGGLAEYK